MINANTHNNPASGDGPTPHGAPSGWQGRTAIVTGAGQGIGYAICEQLIRRGARVVLNDSDPGLADRASCQAHKEGQSQRLICRHDAARDHVVQAGFANP